MSATDPKRVVSQLLDLAKDPDNQVFITKEEGCLSGLVSYLKCDDEEVATIAARALWFLSSTVSNRDRLRSHAGLLEALRAKSGGSNDKLQRLVQDCLGHLDDPSASSGRLGEGFSLVARYRAHTSASESAGYTASENTYPSERTPAKAKKTRPIKIGVDGIREEYWRKQVERALIMVPGVVSVTIDQKREEVVVYARAQEGMLDRLLRALERLGVEGTALDGGDATAPAVKPPTRMPFTALQLPQYLDEDGEEDSYFGTGVVASTNVTSGLEARLEAKRREEASQSTVGGLLSGLGRGLGLW